MEPPLSRPKLSRLDPLQGQTPFTHRSLQGRGAMPPAAWHQAGSTLLAAPTLQRRPLPPSPRGAMPAEYVEHAERPFFSRACRFLCSGPAVAMVWEGLDVVATSRRMIGTTQPSDSAPGTIRGDLGQHFRRNVVHGSDSVESADREVALWFDDDELVSWNQDLANWVLELPNAPVEFGADEDPVHPGSLDSKEGGVTVNDELPYGHSA